VYSTDVNVNWAIAGMGYVGSLYSDCRHVANHVAKSKLPMAVSFKIPVTSWTTTMTLSWATVGAIVGAKVGVTVRPTVGASVGMATVGATDGAVGADVGMRVGEYDGLKGT